VGGCDTLNASRYIVIKSLMDPLQLMPRPSKATQQLLESGAVSSWSNKGRLFVAATVDLNEVFRRNGSVVGPSRHVQIMVRLAFVETGKAADHSY
jgi:hypothetical protein